LLFNFIERTPQLIKNSSVLLLFLLMTACGYHLRGSIQLPEVLKKIYVQGASSPLTDAINQVFSGASGKLVSSSAKAGMILKVINEDYQRRTVSVNASGYSNEYELVYRLSYVLLDKQGTIIVPKQTVSASKSYYNSQNSNVLIAKANEEASLRKEVYVQAVRELVNRARAVLKNKYVD